MYFLQMYCKYLIHISHLPTRIKRPADLIPIVISDEEHKLLWLSLWTFLCPSATSLLLGPDILLSSLLSKALNLSSSLSVSNQVSHPCETTRRILRFVWSKIREMAVIYNPKTSLNVTTLGEQSLFLIGYGGFILIPRQTFPALCLLKSTRHSSINDALSLFGCQILTLDTKSVECC